MSSIDPNALVAGVGAYLGSKELLGKLLGPTAEYLGEGLRDWTKKRLENTNRIFEKADKKLGAKINEKGTVPPRVLKEVVTEGSYVDDELVAEYFGGVLASSRSGVPRDDRGTRFAKLVSQLTSYQVRSHFIFYSLIKELFDGEQKWITGDEIRDLQVFIPSSSYVSAMDFSVEEDVTVILTYVMFGLVQEDLIQRDFRYGSLEFIKKKFGAATGEGIIITASVLGIELYLWAHGMGDVAVSDFLNREITFESDTHITIPHGSVATKKKN